MIKKEVNFIEMMPNTLLNLFTPSTTYILISSNVFVDIEVVRDGSCIRINIAGKPRVKQIIFDKMDDDGQ